LISDAGYQGEITSVSTACHQIEVFSRVLRTSITSFLEGGEDAVEKNLPEFTVSSCFLGSCILVAKGSMQIMLYKGRLMMINTYFTENGLSWRAYILVQSAAYACIGTRERRLKYKETLSRAAEKCTR